MKKKKTYDIHKIETNNNDFFVFPSIEIFEYYHKNLKEYKEKPYLNEYNHYEKAEKNMLDGKKVDH